MGGDDRGPELGGCSCLVRCRAGLALSCPPVEHLTSTCHTKLGDLQTRSGMAGMKPQKSIAGQTTKCPLHALSSWTGMMRHVLMICGSTRPKAFEM